jgi:sterol desaturase/sphingolipid hydroxylase (fatty acid hydroxylase superfamily)
VDHSFCSVSIWFGYSLLHLCTSPSPTTSTSQNCGTVTLVNGMYYCATGRMPFVSNHELFASTLYGIAHVLGWTVAIPLYREAQVYFAHRFIHIKSLYTHFHSVHHRNTDIEPFSGLCMHPIEHLYFFTSVAPSLYFQSTPFLFLWNDIQSIISPGASHSGWEGHSDSDQHHDLHHRYFECNYGTPSFILDNILDTSTKSECQQSSNLGC